MKRYSEHVKEKFLSVVQETSIRQIEGVGTVDSLSKTPYDIRPNVERNKCSVGENGIFL